MRFIVAAACTLAFAALSFSGCNEQQASGTAENTAVSGQAALLVTVPANSKPPAKDQAYANHLPYGAIQDFFFSQNGRRVVYSVRDYGYSYVSVDGKPGKVYKADVTPVVLSPGGGHVAYAAPNGAMWRVVADGVEGEDFKEARDITFSPDGRHLAYLAMKDGTWGMVVDRSWYPGKSSQHGQFLFSGDSSRIAFVDHVGEDYAGRLVVADLKLRGQQVVAAGGVYSIVANADKTRVAAVVSTGHKTKVASFSFANPADVKSGAEYDSINNLVFGPDGVSVAYTGQKNGAKYVVLNDREDLLGDAEPREVLVVRPDLKGVGVLVAGKDDKPYLREFFLQPGKGMERHDGASFLTYSLDGLPAFAAASVARKAWFVVVGGHEGPPFDRVVDPRFTPDGKHLVYRARKDGKRFVVVADRAGHTIRQHAPHEHVFEVHFTADGKLAYGVKDGLKLSWMVEPL